MKKIIVIIEFDGEYQAKSINDQLTLGIYACDPNLEYVKDKYRQLVNQKLERLERLGFDVSEKHLLQFKLLESALKKVYYKKRRGA